MDREAIGRKEVIWQTPSILKSLCVLPALQESPLDMRTREEALRPCVYVGDGG